MSAHRSRAPVVVAATAAALGVWVRSSDAVLVCADLVCLGASVPVTSPLRWLAFAHRAALGLTVVLAGAQALGDRRAMAPRIAGLCALAALGGRVGAEVSLLEPVWVGAEGAASLGAVVAATVGLRGVASHRGAEAIGGAALVGLALALGVAVDALGARGVCLDWPGCPTREPDLARLELARRMALAGWALVAAGALARWRGHPRIGAWSRVALRLSVAVLALDAAAFFTDHAVEIEIARVAALHGALVGAIWLLGVEWTDAAQSATSGDAFPLPAPRAHP